MNGDGFGDILIGAPLYDAGELDEGAAFIHLGSASGVASGSPASAHARLESNQADSEMGRSVASLGDLYGDGFADVVIGAPGYDEGQSDEGIVLVFNGSEGGIANGNPSTAFARFVSNQLEARLGTSVASAGDVDGDGFGDMIFGASAYGSGSIKEGLAFLFLGNTLRPTEVGRSSFPRQRRGIGSAVPVATGGGSFAPDRFRVELVARSPRGRDRARLEVEVCQTGIPFGHASCVRATSPSWADLGTSGAVLGHTVTGLAANTTYAWRARAAYLPYTAAPPGIALRPARGPWFRQQSWTTADIRTVPEPESIGGVLIGAILLAGFRRRRPPSGVRSDSRTGDLGRH